MRRLTKLSSMALAVLLGLSVTGRAAAPLEERVPGDAIVYLGWAGSDALAGQYNASNLKAFIAASTAPAYITEQLPKLIALGGRNDPTFAPTIAKIQTGLGVAWRHPTAFYFCPVDFAKPQQPEFSFGFICDAGAEANTLAGFLKEAIAGNAQPQPLPINVTASGTFVSLTFGKQPDAARQATMLANNTTYKKAMGQIKVAKPALAAYVDLAKGMAVFKEALAKVPGPNAQEQAMVLKVMDLLGLNGLNQMAMGSGFDGKEWSSQAFVGVSGQPKGLLTLLGNTPLSETVLSVVPREAASFSSFKLDLPKIYADARSIIGQIDADALKRMDQVLALAPTQIGLDIEKDILAPLGDEWVYYRAPLSELGGNSFALVHKLRDNDRFAKTLGMAEALANKAGAGLFKIDKVTMSSIEFSTITYQNYSVAWTVRKGYLYISTMDGMAGAVKQVENKLPSIAESDLYKKALAQVAVAGAKPMTLSYSNPAKLYPEIRRALVGLLPLARAAGVDIPATLLPEVDTVLPLLTPGAGISWWDAEGWHQSSHSSFPGAELISGNISGGPLLVAGGAMGVAVLLPSLGQAREQANRSTSMANLRGLGMSSVIYSADNNDNMPDDPARLVADGMIASKQLVNKRAGATTPLELTPEVQKLAKDDFAKFAAQVAEHSDYVYLGKGTKNSMESGLVLAYEKPGPGITDGICIVFGDCHAEFVRFGGLAATFARTNEMLQKAGRPPVDVQDILRKCNAVVPPIGPGAGPTLISPPPPTPGRGMP